MWRLMQWHLDKDRATKQAPTFLHCTALEAPCLQPRNFCLQPGGQFHLVYRQPCLLLLAIVDCCLLLQRTTGWARCMAGMPRLCPKP